MVTCVSDTPLNILPHTFKKATRSVFPFLHKQVQETMAHANLSLSTQKAGLLEMNYSVSEDGKAKKTKTIY